MIATTATDPPDRLLLIGPDAADAAAVRAALADVTDGVWVVDWVTRLADGLDRLSRTGIAVVLIDLHLPDSQGLAGVERVLHAAPHVPILVLSSVDEEDLARQAVQRGARDYLLKGHLDSHLLPRALRNVIERKAADETLFEEKERAEVTLNSIGDAVISTDISGHVTYLNAVAERMTGWGRDEARGRPRGGVLRSRDGPTREAAR